MAYDTNHHHSNSDFDKFPTHTTSNPFLALLQILQNSPYILPLLYLLAGVLAHKAFTDPNPKPRSASEGQTTYTHTTATANKHESTLHKTQSVEGGGRAPEVLNSGGGVGGERGYDEKSGGYGTGAGTVGTTGTAHRTAGTGGGIHETGTAYSGATGNVHREGIGREGLAHDTFGHGVRDGTTHIREAPITTTSRSVPIAGHTPTTTEKASLPPQQPTVIHHHGPNSSGKDIEEPLLIRYTTNPALLCLIRHLGITLPLLHAALRHILTTLPKTISMSTTTITATTTTATRNHQTHTIVGSTSSSHHNYPPTTSVPASSPLINFLLPKNVICPTNAQPNPDHFACTVLLPLALLIGSSALRLLCFKQLKKSFSFRLREPTTPLVTTGMYKYIRHPSYLLAALSSAILLYFITGGVLPRTSLTSSATSHLDPNSGMYEYTSSGRKYDAYGRVSGAYADGLGREVERNFGENGEGGGGMLRCYFNSEKEAVLVGRLLWAMWSGIMPLWCVLRINGEERMLREKVAGYREYAKRTWKLIPGIW